ncbi:hypothetical protein C2S52_018931 [Perilla frutescens var. hirtella]|nr:hypothetical protein C2S52_018931 [Perilla frutescens var. hirtella]
MEIMKLLSCYTWEAKIAIVLASFVVEYSQYRLVSLLCNDNPFAKLVGIMKHKREDVEEINYVTKFEKIISLVKVSIEVTKFISKFSCLPSKYISNKAEPMVAASSQIPIAVYWITRVVVACASEFTQIFLGQSQTLQKFLARVKWKTVLLFISDLDISSEIFLLKKIYLESREKAELQYEIVWLPIVRKIEQDEEFKQKFEDLKLKMPCRGKVLEGGVELLEEADCGGVGSAGKVANPNAFRMLWTWGNAAYPFNQSHELDMWSRQEWSLKFLVDGIDQTFTKWIQEDKVICLYGGEDYEWIQEFITRSKQVANAAGIQIEMVYMGKNTSKQHIKKLTEILAGRSLFWEDPTLITSYFWKRIKSMMHSKIHHGAKVGAVKETGDHILVEVLNMLMLGGSDQGWALIGQGAGSGPGKIARAKGDVILKALVEFKSWSAEIKHEGFVTALNGYLAGRKSKEHCSRLILLELDDIRAVVVCPECRRPMKNYRCCTD